MKRLLLFSLILNPVLLCLLWARSGRLAPMPRQPRSVVGLPAAHTLQRTRLAGSATTQPSTPWAALEATDPARFIANLRAAGCPEQTIRDLATFRGCRAFRQRLLELEAESVRNWDYTRQRRDWKELGAQRRELRDEMIASLEDLFGRSWMSLTTALLGWPERGSDGMEFFSPEKRQQLRELDRRIGRLTQDLEQKRAMGDLDAEGRARLLELDRQKRAELAIILSPTELEEYLYRRSTTADYVRRNLPSAKTEAEFRTMVKVAQEFDAGSWSDPAMFAMRYGIAGEADEAAQAVEKQKAAFNKRLKEVLGEDRIAQQQAEEQARAEQERKAQKERDKEQFRFQITDLAAEVGIPAENAYRFFQRVMELEPVLKPKFEELEKNLTGTEEEKNQKMEAAFKAELRPLAVEILGEKGPALLDKMAKEAH